MNSLYIAQLRNQFLEVKQMFRKRHDEWRWFQNKSYQWSKRIRAIPGNMYRTIWAGQRKQSKSAHLTLQWEMTNQS